MKTSWTALLPQNQIGAKCDLEWYASPQFLKMSCWCLILSNLQLFFSGRVIAAGGLLMANCTASDVNFNLFSDLNCGCFLVQTDDNPIQTADRADFIAFFQIGQELGPALLLLLLRTPQNKVENDSH